MCRAAHLTCTPLFAAAAVFCGGCVTPAEPDLAQPAAELMATARTEPTTSTAAPWPAAPSGKYVMMIETILAGPMYALVEAESLDGGKSFKANTRPGIAWKNLPAGDGAIGALLAPFIFPRGMVIHMRASMPAPEPAATAKGFIGAGTLAVMRVPLWVQPDGLLKVMLQDKAVAALSLRGLESQSPFGPDAGTGYAAAVGAMTTVARAHWYDQSAGPTGVGSAAFAAFTQDAAKHASEAHDDLEMLFGLVTAWRKQKDLPLPVLYRTREAGSVSRTASLGLDGSQPATLQLDADSSGTHATVTLGVVRSSVNLSATLGALSSADLRSVVLDLRNCPGLEVGLLQVAQHLIAAPVSAGVWFGGADRADVARGASSPRRMELREAADFAAAEQALQAGEHVELVVMPAPSGDRLSRVPLSLIISRRTSGLGEVLAHVIARSRRGEGKATEQDTDANFRIFGEATSTRPQYSVEVALDVPVDADQLAAAARSGLELSPWAARIATMDWRRSLAAAKATDGAAASVEVAKCEPLAADETGNREESLKRAASFARSRAARAE